MNTVQRIKVTMMFDLTSLPLDLAHVAKVSHRNRFSSFEIIKRITCFSQFELCFETLAGYIPFYHTKH